MSGNFLIVKIYRMKRLITFLFLAAALPMTVKAQKKKIKHVVLIGVDGLGAYAFKNTRIPHLKALMARGSSVTSYISSAKPDFLFVHLHDVDSVGHNAGHDTPDYYAAVERTDAYIGQIIESLQQAGILEQTLVIATADHGGINKGHGGKTMVEMEIPWIIAGPGIRKNFTVVESIMTFDTAATIAAALQLQAPQVWIGRPVRSVFGK